MVQARFPHPRIGLGHDGEPGWLRNALTKPQAEDMLGQALRQHCLTIRTAETLYQLRRYVVRKDGRTGAAPGAHDDLVTAWQNGLLWERHEASRRTKSDLPLAGGPNLRPTGLFTPPGTALHVGPVAAFRPPSPFPSLRGNATNPPGGPWNP
jgi:hypothetical protein